MRGGSLRSQENWPECMLRPQPYSSL